jgi:hypothetical protein
MVEPHWVIEISCLDLIPQSISGAPVLRMVLDWDHAARCYRAVRRLPLVSVISPQFIRLRDDKTVCPSDVRIRQVTDVVEVPLADRDARQITLPASEVLRREVYTKPMKGETIVRKFVLWKTNKEQVSDDYPAFVLHYTDFSPNRKMPLERELRVSNSREQIDELWEELKCSSLSKGWELRGDLSQAIASANSTSPTDSTAEASTKETGVKTSPTAREANRGGKRRTSASANQ